MVSGSQTLAKIGQNFVPVLDYAVSAFVYAAGFYYVARPSVQYGASLSGLQDLGITGVLLKCGNAVYCAASDGIYLLPSKTKVVDYAATYTSGAVLNNKLYFGTTAGDIVGLDGVVNAFTSAVFLSNTDKLYMVNGTSVYTGTPDDYSLIFDVDESTYVTSCRDVVAYMSDSVFFSKGNTMLVPALDESSSVDISHHYCATQEGLYYTDGFLNFTQLLEEPCQKVFEM